MAANGRREERARAQGERERRIAAMIVAAATVQEDHARMKLAEMPGFSRFVLVALGCVAGVALAAPAASGLDLAGLDASVRPQDDLYRAANGAWLQATEIPPDKARYGAIIRLRDVSDARVEALVKELAGARPAPGTDERKIAAYYSSSVDTDAIDQAGLAPIRPWLEGIAAIRTPAQLARWLGAAQGIVNTPVNLSVMPDFGQPGIDRPVARQGGLGMPDRDYYLKTGDPRLSKARAAYATYLEALARHAGEPDPPAAARRVLALEDALARMQWDNVDNRDPVKVYNPMSAAELAQRSPGFDWAAFLEAASLRVVDRIVVHQPGYAAGVARLLGEAPLDDWKLYLSLRSLDDAASVLPRPLRDARFAFREAALAGTRSERPRWQQSVAEVNGALGEAVGRAYVQRHFAPEHKARMLALVGNLLAAYSESIAAAGWLTEATRARALEKLSKYQVKIGYPDRWRDYGALEVRAGDAFGNWIRARRFEWLRKAAKAGQPVERSEWGMTPQTVNAYYSPTRNEIVFPAAILQPPFFDPRADDAMNYGAIGAIIGHEISHGFDDHGSRFDGDGALRSWWTDADRRAFDALGERLAAQYGAYEPLAGRHINGKLTMGENIADLSGLQIAYKAYRRSLGGKPAPRIDGYSGEQRFFIGWAQAWRDKERDEALTEGLTVDPHSPPEFRANGAAVNHDGFHDAFGTRPGDRMFRAPQLRVRIW